jgi:signal transduction histidine kinase
VTNTDSEVNIAVTDHGIGIDPAMLPRVFDLFAQATGVSADRMQGSVSDLPSSSDWCRITADRWQ